MSDKVGVVLITFTTRWSPEHEYIFRKYTILVFLEMKAAFDSVDRTDLRYSLSLQGILFRSMFPKRKSGSCLWWSFIRVHHNQWHSSGLTIFTLFFQPRNWDDYECRLCRMWQQWHWHLFKHKTAWLRFSLVWTTRTGSVVLSASPTEREKEREITKDSLQNSKLKNYAAEERFHI